MRRTLRFFAVVLSMAFVLSVFPARSLFAAATSGKCGKNLTWKVSGDTLTISGSGKMYDWNTDDDVSPPWADFEIKNVVFSGNVTSIGDDAFSYCSKLTSINIPKSVTSIGDGAFQCSGIKKVTIPNTVKWLGWGAFLYCESLTSVSISNKVTKICDYTFANCTRLTTLVIPNSVTTIGVGAFEECKKLTNIVIPDSVVSIGINAFYGCINLTSVSGGAKVKAIGEEAFAKCPKLSTFALSSSVLKKIGPFAFNGDTSLKTIFIKRTTKLTKKGVKKSLKGSSVKTVKVKKSKVKKYKKFFTKKNCGRKVKVKK